MVLKDAVLDELWRELGGYRGKIREHLEAAIETEQTMASMVTERLIREYRDLKADYEHDHEALEKLQADYQRRLSDISEWKKKWYDTNKKYEELQRQLMQRR